MTWAMKGIVCGLGVVKLAVHNLSDGGGMEGTFVTRAYKYHCVS